MTPPPAQALALLHRLAADRGIVGVMQRRQWSVGGLREMPPVGEVAGGEEEEGGGAVEHAGGTQ